MLPARGPAAPVYKLRVYRRHKGEPKGFTWQDYLDLIIAAHRQLSAPMVWCWEYVPQNIFPVLCPVRLCGRWRQVVRDGDGLARMLPLRPHNAS